LSAPPASRSPDYLCDRLWTRIGSEFDSSWSLDRENGFEKMESGINARAIDFAKLGRLYLAGGSWDGEQIVPAQHGQLVFVQPDRRLIIVRLGERYGISAFEWFELFSGLEDRLSS
jgi:CubicO group peptidase (beta-lactamase class C family)